jgi:iron complex outermembrane receptor protein
MKDSRKSVAFLAGLLAPASALVSMDVLAQEPTAGELEEITVTARRVQESLQDTPIAITVLTANALESRQIFSTDALDQVVPNLQFSNNAPLAGNNASSQIFIRGIGQTDPTSTVDPGVGLYIDDVYMGTAVGGTMAFRDIANVQVLRGPQGTLFGRNTMGGAILLTTTEPGEEFGGTVRVGAGSDSLGEFFGAVDAPFSESLRSRFTFGLRKQDGYVKRNIGGEDLGDTNTWTATGKLLFKPSDKFSATFNLDYTKADENGNPQVLAALNEAATFPRVASLDAGCPGLTDVANPMGIPDQPTPATADPRCANAAQVTGPYTNNGTFPLESLLESYGTSLKLEFNLSEALALKSISAWRGISWEGIRDADNTPLTILHTDYDVDAWQWSQELQLTYQSAKFTGVVGAYYFAQGSDDIVTVQLNTPAPGVQADSDNNKVENKSWAAFTQWTWNFTDSLGATLGARYSTESKGSYPDQFDLATPAVKQVPVQWYEDDFTDFTPSASFNWRWNETGMVYLSYAQGFKGGGWNSHFNAPQTQTVLDAVHKFDQEEATTWEAGVKLDLFDRTLRLNAAVFTSDYTNLQITYRVVAAPYLANAGKASIDGAELELTWLPTPDLTIAASVGKLDAKIDRLDINPVATPPPGLAVGNELPFAPDLQASLGIGYDIHAGNLKLTPRVDASYQDTTYFDAQNTREIAQLDSYEVVNASFAIRPDQGAWRVLLGVNNATDEEYRVAGNSSLTTGSGYAEVAFARPRTWFGHFSYDF